MQSTASTIKFLADPEFQVSSGGGSYQDIPILAENIETLWDLRVASGEQDLLHPAISINIIEPLYYVSESEEEVLQRSLLRSAIVIDAGRLI